MISLSIVWYEQCSLTGLSASSLIFSSPLTSSLYILDFDVLVCLLRSLYLLHPTSSFDFLFGVFLFLHLFCLPFAGCFLLMVAYFSQSSLAVAFLKTDLVSVLFYEFYLFVLFASSHTSSSLLFLSFILSPTRAFAPDRSFLFPNSQRMPTHSLVHSPLRVIMHACALLRSPL